STLRPSDHFPGSRAPCPARGPYYSPRMSGQRVGSARATSPASPDSNAARGTLRYLLPSHSALHGTPTEPIGSGPSNRRSPPPAATLAPPSPEAVSGSRPLGPWQRASAWPRSGQPSVAVSCEFLVPGKLLGWATAAPLNNTDVPDYGKFELHRRSAG